jgi:hypothetical protein
MALTSNPERWIVLTYRVPRTPTANRVYVWRKLKQLGAIALQDAAWVLPATPKTQEHFQWLAAEIAELGGEARLWHSTLQLEISDETLRKQFEAQAAKEYKEILTKLKQKNRDLSSLARQYQRIVDKDFFLSDLGNTVRRKLLAAEEKAS